MTINFYLDQKGNKKEKAILVYVRGIIPRKTKVIHSGVYCTSKDWDQQKQMVRRSVVNCMEQNSYLQSVKLKLTNTYKSYVEKNNTLIYEELIDELISSIKAKESTQANQLLTIYKNFLEAKKLTFSVNTLKRHVSLTNHIQRFISNKKGVTIQDVDHNFLERFINFLLIEVSLTNNTATKYILAFRTFLRWAESNGYSTSESYKQLKVKSENVEIIYLTESELQKIIDIDLSEKPALNRVRNLFCFQCFTGQRFGDVRSLNATDIVDNYWLLRTEKTKDIIRVPLSSQAKLFLQKLLEGEKSLVISTQKANDHLKEIGRLAGLMEEEKIVRYRGAEKIEIRMPKFNFLSTHVARRTFVTLSLEKGMRPEIVMRITGHKDYKTFKKYIKITEKVTENELKRIWG